MSRSYETEWGVDRGDDSVRVTGTGDEAAKIASLLAQDYRPGGKAVWRQVTRGPWMHGDVPDTATGAEREPGSEIELGGFVYRTACGHSFATCHVGTCFRA